MKRFPRLLAIVPALLGSVCFGGETITRKPQLGSVRANAPIPRRFHITNEGGSDGSGLCVNASVLAAGMTQGVPALMKGKESAYWKYCKSTPGGSYPEKLAAYLEKTVPGEKYAQVTTTNPAILDRLSRQGLVLCMTLNTGDLYKGQPIHHMVDYPHYDSRRNIACFRDNNDPPGIFRWITAKEAARRWIDGGTGWVFVWLRRHPAAAASYALLVSLAALVLVAYRRSTLDEFEDGQGDVYEGW